MVIGAPSGAELKECPLVRAALEAAWADSLPNWADYRHEEGGWIYQNWNTGELFIKRAWPGVRTAIDLSNPPVVAGAVVVGMFHTHPNPTAEGWDPGPSWADWSTLERDGVPDLILADVGVYYSDAIRRRGGLGGNPGFPV